MGEEKGVRRRGQKKKKDAKDQRIQDIIQELSADPERFRRMHNAYERYVEDNGVLPVPVDYDQVQQVGVRGYQALGKRYGGIAALFGLLVVACCWSLGSRFSRRRIS